MPDPKPSSSSTAEASASASAAAAATKRKEAAREVIDTLHEMATLLNTHLTRTQLSYCVSLIENGVNPEALAAVIREIRSTAQTQET